MLIPLLHYVPSDMNDLKFALRQLRKSPAFTLIAVITLALGIGLNTTIFSLINDLFLRGLPFKEPSRVVHLDNGDKARDLADVGISAPRYQLYRDGQTIFDGFAAENSAAQNSSPFTLTGLGDPVQIFGGRVTSNYFDVLGVRPILGRNFLPKEEESADVALVTKNFWQERLGGDPNVIGRSITLDGTPHTIVGVLPNVPAAWFGANPIAEVWTTKPFQLPGFSHEQLMRGSFFLRVVGRLKPGVTLQQARAALPSLEQSYRAQYPNNIDSEFVTTLRILPEDVTRNFRAGFATLFAAVSFVLLIACSNVANLLLVRFDGRRREIALRIAIGASRTSVIRLFVAESLLVSVVAGAGGAFAAWHLVPLVPGLASKFLPLETATATSLSIPVLLFAIGLSISTGLLMGIYPALQGSQADLIDGLKEGEPRDEWQCAPTAPPQNPRRRASRALGHFVGRRGAADHEFHPLESAEPWLPSPESLDGCDYTADLAVSQTVRRVNVLLNKHCMSCAVFPGSRARLLVAIFRWLASVVIFMPGVIVMFRQSRSVRSCLVTKLLPDISKPGECRSWLAASSMSATPPTDRKFV